MSEFGHFAARGPGFSIDAWGAGPFVIEASGKRYRFEDSDRFGPQIVKKNGDIRDWQPGENHPFWAAWEAWVSQGRRLAGDKETCIFSLAPISTPTPTGGDNG